MSIKTFLQTLPYSALINFEVFADLILPAKIAPSKLHPLIIAACSAAKNQLLIKSLYRYFTANKDPSGPLSRIVPSSSIEAANAPVDIPTNHRFNIEGHSPAAVLLVGVVQLGRNLFHEKIRFWQPQNNSNNN